MIINRFLAFSITKWDRNVPTGYRKEYLVMPDFCILRRVYMVKLRTDVIGIIRDLSCMFRRGEL